MNRHAKASISAVIITLISGCGGLPKAHYYESGVGYQSAAYEPQGRKLGASGNPNIQGQDFCRDLENAARVHSIGLTRWGWFFGGSAIASAGAGTVLIATTPEKSSTGRNALNAAIPLGAGLLGLIAAGFLGRADDASDAASTAAAALVLSNDKDKAVGADRRANDDCNQALATWNDGRGSANQILAQRLKDQKAQEGPGNGTPGTIPQGNAPQGNGPQATPPQGNGPQANPPQANPPQGNAPQANPPQGNAPQANAPQGNAPQANPPRANPPRANPPRANPPQANTPQGTNP
ncbi:hypothetical protein [Sorangium sp. So ce385]|uniref:hypothetical protein n=1 Tax=Sorangium sp. So ce385 TaxID=3133308 RepID=UPI003F5C1DD6